MPLLLLDLDNTLVDRDAAFRAAVADFLAEHGLPTSDLNWAMAIDASGYTSRQEVAAAMTDRYGDVVTATAIRALLDNGAADRVILSRSAREALGKAQAIDWTCVIVTNGRAVQQEAKIRNAGLDQLVEGWVISEASATGSRNRRSSKQQLLPSASLSRARGSSAIHLTPISRAPTRSVFEACG